MRCSLVYPPLAHYSSTVDSMLQVCIHSGCWRAVAYCPRLPAVQWGHAGASKVRDKGEGVGI